MLDLTDWQNKKYQTAVGNPVRILCVDAKRRMSNGNIEDIVGLILDADGTHRLTSWRIDGAFSLQGRYCDDDLINAKTKKEGWVVVYPARETGRTDAVAPYVYPFHIAGEVAISCNGVVGKIEWEE